MNKKLYKKLLSFRSHSKSETQLQFRDWLQAYIETHYDNVLTAVDEYGNLYVQKSEDDSYEYVNCVVAHLDINQKTITDDFSILEAGNYIIGIDNNTGTQIGLGHDDKTGVYFALQALKKFKNIKCFFPLDEEVGLVGSRNSMDSFFGDVGFFLQLDRRGYSDISHYTNGHDVVDRATKLELEKLICKYNFNWVSTVSTDIGYLTERHETQGTNMSCGYKDEHTEKETLNVLRYMTSEKLGLAILKKTDNKYYPLKVKRTATTSTTNTSTATNSTSSASTTSSTNSSSSTSTTSTASSTASSVAGKPTNATTSTTVVNNVTETEKKKFNSVKEPIEELEDAIYNLGDIFPITDSDVKEYIELVNTIYDGLNLLPDSHDRDTLYCLLYNNVRDNVYGMGKECDQLVTKLAKEWYRINNWDYDAEYENDFYY